MKLAALCLLSAVCAAASNLAADLQPAAATIPSLSDEAAPEPTVLSAEDNAILDARQAPANPTAVQAESAPPTITTDWRPTVLPNKQTTWYPDIYTQTFPKVPGQLPSPGVGSIGYGTLSKKNGKRTAEPESAGAEVTATVLAQPIVLVVQTTVVLQPVQRVTEVRVVETVLESASPSSASSSSLGFAAAASFHPTGTGALHATGTGSHGTAALPIANPRNGTVEWFLRKEGG